MVLDTASTAAEITVESQLSVTSAVEFSEQVGWVRPPTGADGQDCRPVGGGMVTGNQRRDELRGRPARRSVRLVIRPKGFGRPIGILENDCLWEARSRSGRHDFNGASNPGRFSRLLAPLNPSSRTIGHHGSSQASQRHPEAAVAGSRRSGPVLVETRT
jgi:hypothetical protein